MESVAAIRPSIISVSVYAFCALEKDCFKRDYFISKEDKRKWIDSHELHILDGKVYTPVVTLNGKLFWMGAMTGALYDNSGCCMSGELYINLNHMRHAQDECAALLMSKRSDK